MKTLAVMLLFLLSAHTAQAQQAGAPASAQQQQASVDPYIASITPLPPSEQDPSAPPSGANAPRPSDYGQSVITDIRQMNF